MAWETVAGLLEAEVTRDERRATVRFAGELDLSSCRAARHTIDRVLAERASLVLDLSRVTFCGAEGVHLLVAVRDEAASRGTHLALHHPNRSVCRVMELTGVRALFDTVGWSPPPEPLDAKVVGVVADALEEARDATGSAMGTAQIWDPSCGALRIVAHHGFGRDFLSFFEIVGSGGSGTSCGAALAAAEPTFVNDIGTSPLFAGTPGQRVLLDAGSRAVASVPVRSEDNRVVAVFSPHYRHPVDWDETLRRDLRKVARSAELRLAA